MDVRRQNPVRLVIGALALALSLQSGAADAAEPAKAPRPGGRSEAPSGTDGARAKARAREGRGARAAREKMSVGGRDRGGEATRDRGRTKDAKDVKDVKDAKDAKDAKDVKDARETKKAAPVIPPVSVGHPNEGRLEGGARLDDSLPFIRAVSVCPGVDAQWGLPVLVRMIERAARAVAKRHPGSVLNVGDISRKQGGEIDGHHSHESGRDADIGFYVADAKNNPLDTRSFLKFEASLTSRQMPGARFDVARNWLLIQHMLTDPAARVSHIFIAEPLRQSLLAHARSRGVSRALWNRAAVVMMQPTGSLPHDDHIHVRISCPRSLLGSGECIELAKNAKPARARHAQVTKLRRRGAAPPLVTPSGSRGGRLNEARKAAPAAREAAKVNRRPAGGEGLARAEASQDSSDSALKRAFDAAATGLFGGPQEDAEGEADAAEVRDAVDDGGSVKITD